MSTDTLRIGFIGAGGICRSRHLPGLAGLDGVEVVVVCNRSRESSERVARDFGIAEVDDDWQRVIARDDPDIIPHRLADCMALAKPSGLGALAEQPIEGDDGDAQHGGDPARIDAGRCPGPGQRGQGMVPSEVFHLFT